MTLKAQTNGKTQHCFQASAHRLIFNSFVIITCFLLNSVSQHQPRTSYSPCHNRRHLPQTLTKTPILAISFPLPQPNNPPRQQKQTGGVGTRETERKGVGEEDGERERKKKGGGGRERVSEKGRRHNNRRGKLRRSREIRKTLTIEEHRGSVPYRETCVKWRSCLSCGAEILFPRVYRVINYSTDWFGERKALVSQAHTGFYSTNSAVFSINICM